MNRILKLIAVVLLLFVYFNLSGQERIQISGVVKDVNGNYIELVAVALPGTSSGNVSDTNGRFSFSCPFASQFRIEISRLGYIKKTLEIHPQSYPDSSNIELDIVLERSVENLNEVVVKANRDPGTNLVRLDPKVISMMPDPAGHFEQILRSQMGVASNNELSSQYSVRGGNFDENLVYVNDIEIYRPFLIRSGQQEGLSFINSDLVSSVLFSSGGFDAKYGDKMSSVLDIRYKKPVDLSGSLSGSLMGGSAHIEGTSSTRRFTYLAGVRYKSSKYLLNSLETRGDYNPRFTDFQTYLTYDVNAELELSFLGNIANNAYEFIPVNRETSFGHVNEALKLMIYFDGQELDAFTTYLGALTATYRPSNHLELKLITSSFTTGEAETFDIQGQYLLNELDRNLGSETFSDSILNLGVGTFLDHARNYLRANVMSIEHKGSYLKDLLNIQWGARAQTSSISDQIEEWSMIDSAGYSLPYSDTTVQLWSTFFASSELIHQQYSGYFRSSYEKKLDRGNLIMTGGIRGTYTNINNEFLVSPRFSLSFLPAWEKDLQFRLSAGAYHQPPFFKEFRNLKGEMNLNAKAQKSVHIVAGTDYYFLAWDRQFKFTTELYYKYLWDLIPYEVENVRIRYYGDNMAKGYAAGIDLKVFGQFVPGIDSWASLSVMQTQEDIEGDTIGYIPRPTDQRLNLGLFFQDYFPGNKTYKAHLNLLFGTGLPFGPPGSQENKSAFRVPSYRRVDLGFSKSIYSAENRPKNQKFNVIKSLWVGVEIFNLLDINNTVSHIWIKDITNRQYAIPNYLTGRRFNIKIQANF